MIFDPPWDAEQAFKKPVISEQVKNILSFTDGQRAFDTITLFGPPTWLFGWDCVTSWYAPNRPLKRVKYCLWYGDVNNFNFNGAHYGSAGEVKNVTNTRGSYEFKPDERGKHLSDLFQYQITKLHNEVLHSHSKPLDWVRLLIGDCSTGNVLDLFGGSGTTLIACEQLNRACFMIEIEVRNVAMIIDRWEKFTGEKAILTNKV